MGQESWDVFDAISHEVRRKIITLLAEKPRTFSDLQRELGLESPALAFHLKKLNGLIAKDSQGYYGLTPLGMKAYDVIRQIQGISQGSVEGDKAETGKGWLSSLASRISSGLSELIAAFTDLPLIINVGNVTLKEVFNGPLPVKRSLSIEVDGGKVEITKGDPYAVIKCADESGFNLSTTDEELTVSLEGCVAKVSYPPVESLRGSVDGGLFRAEGSASGLTVDLDGGVLYLDVDDLTSARVAVDGGSFRCKLKYAREGILNLELDGGAGELEVSLPPEVGIVFNKNVDGGVIKGGRNVVKERNVTANISVDGGVVRVETKTADSK